MLSYSFHISKGNHSINTKANLKSCSDHNHRNYENVQEKNFEMNLELSNENYILKGTNNAYQDVKNFYQDYFEESRIKYNQKQTRDDRKIVDYFDKISDDSKKQLAVEIIVQIGDKNFWKNKSIKERKQMDQVFQEQLSFLEKELPNFKICNAVVHHDEASPHVQIIGVPCNENNKTGLEKQVSKKAVFTKEVLKELQNKMREHAIESFNKNYKTKEVLKEKEKGRNKDFTTQEIREIRDLEKQKEILQKEIKNLKEYKIISSPQEKDLQNYILHKKNIENLKKLTDINIKKALGGIFGEKHWYETAVKTDQILAIKDCVSKISTEIIASEKILRENLEQKEELKELDRILKRQQNTIDQKNSEIQILEKEKIKIIQENEKNNKILLIFLEKSPNFREKFEEVKKKLYPEEKNPWEEKLKKEKSRGWER